MKQQKYDEPKNHGDGSDKTTELKKVGLISDAHGIRGEVYVILFSGDNSWIQDMKTITLKANGSAPKDVSIELNIKKIKPFKKGFLCSFPTITTRNQAEELKKLEIWIDANFFVSEDGDQPFLAELLDFLVCDTASGNLGKVIGFSSNGQQDLLVLSQVVNFQNVEIPFIKQFVINVDYQEKKITTTLPEGLIGINEKD